MNLNPSQFSGWKQDYERDGFFTLPNLLDASLHAALDAELDRYIREVAPTLPPSDIVWEPEPLPDGRRGIRNLWRLADYSPFFREFASAQPLMDLAAVLVNGDPVMVQVETFSKPAYVGTVVPFHQDNAYFNLTPPDCFSLWIALDASTLSNGCVRFVPGSHLREFPHGASGVKGNSMMAVETDEALEEVPAILDPGSASVHHCMTMHRSDPNRSPAPRRALVIVYQAAHCRVDEAARARYQRILSELLARS
ncbi:MAG: phytanoyl-CoA dioxygenase family protein [Acidobacteria bacterium]|nr:phytanoyl-CoA dioxygenase family protein [Acidobacteriota bacterium]